LGGVLTWNEWNWEESRKTLKHAIELNPNHSVAHQYLAELLYILDEKSEARHEINQAIELDPISFIHRTISYAGYFYEEKFNESLLECDKVLEINPNHPSAYIYSFYNQIALSNDSLAVEAVEKRMSLDTLRKKDVPVIHEIYRQSKLEGIVKYLIESEKNKIKPNPLSVSSYYCILGEKENALNWLETAFNNKSTEIPRINVNPNFDILRAEPRFLKIIDEMGLTKYHKRKPKPITNFNCIIHLKKAL
jgi:tetratricopeptide (TPR) repeat protein